MAFELPALAYPFDALEPHIDAMTMEIHHDRHHQAYVDNANAALAGMGKTRRILLSDTLLADYSEDEIEVILAHELAHHVYRDIWSGIALEAVLILAGFAAADRALAQFSGADLGGIAIKAALERAGVSGDQVDYVYRGQVLMGGAGQSPARQAAVKGGMSAGTSALIVGLQPFAGRSQLSMRSISIVSAGGPL